MHFKKKFLSVDRGQSASVSHPKCAVMNKYNKLMLLKDNKRKLCMNYKAKKEI